MFLMRNLPIKIIRHNAKNSVITPHIGSRTFESVQRQAGMAAKNLILALKGKKPLAQANEAPLVKYL